MRGVCESERDRERFLSTHKRFFFQYKMNLSIACLFIICVSSYSYARKEYHLSDDDDDETRLSTNPPTATVQTPIGCVCGVFLSGQFKKGSKDQPKGNAPLLHKLSNSFACTNIGNKLCTKRCLNIVSILYARFSLLLLSHHTRRVQRTESIVITKKIKRMFGISWNLRKTKNNFAFLSLFLYENRINF